MKAPAVSNPVALARRYQSLGKVWFLKKEPMISTESTPSVPRSDFSTAKDSLVKRLPFAKKIGGKAASP